MQKEAIVLPEAIQTVLYTNQAFGYSLVMVAREDTLVGVIAALHKRQVKTVIISGDQAASTQALAEALNSDQYFAN